MIKKHFLPALAVVAAGLMAACSGESEYHYTGIFYPEGNVGEVFVDQRIDSIKFITFDDWQMASLTSWATLVGPTSGKLPSNSYVQLAIPVRFEINPEDTSRLAAISLSSYKNILSAYFVQRNFHNVTRPYVYSHNKRQPFEGTIKKDAKEDSIAFVAYEPWEVTLDEDAAAWITLRDEHPNGGIGEHVVKFDVANFPATAPKRTGKIMLTTPSIGKTTPITLTQSNE